MNRDQYLQKKGWRSRPLVQSAQLPVPATQGDPASPASSPQAVLAVARAPLPAGVRVAMKSTDRDSSPPLRQQSVLPGTK